MTVRRPKSPEMLRKPLRMALWSLLLLHIFDTGRTVLDWLLLDVGHIYGFALGAGGAAAEEVFLDAPFRASERTWPSRGARVMPQSAARVGAMSAGVMD